jgi:hypothetical protein
MMFPSNDWREEAPSYPGLYWGYTQHGTVEMVRAHSVIKGLKPRDEVLSYAAQIIQPTVGIVFETDDGAVCHDAERWKMWQPVVPPVAPHVGDWVVQHAGGRRAVPRRRGLHRRRGRRSQLW